MSDTREEHVFKRGDELTFADVQIWKPMDTTEFDDQLRRLAKRLGVEPNKPSAFGYNLVTQTGERESFSVMDLLHAFLDKMEKSDVTDTD